MNANIVLPLALGVIGILQGAFNRSMSNSIGLTWATVLGSVITIVVCAFFFISVKLYPEIYPDFVRLKNLTFKWWYFIPGIMGFCIVAGLPLAIYKVGAVKTTVGLIAAQMVTSVLWDKFIEGIELTATKGVGIVFALLSVIMISFF